MTQETHASTPSFFPPLSEIVRYDPFLQSLPQIDTISPVIGGVAHWVYKISDGENNYFLKVRGDHFSSLPTITCDARDIEVEYHAIQLFERLIPDHVPHIHSYNKDTHYMILSDVIGKDKKMEDILLHEQPSVHLFAEYGKTLRLIHDKTKTFTHSIRTDGDDAYYNKVLFHRFGYRHHPILDTLIKELSALPDRQIILGDYAPKNIGVKTEPMILTLFDLETAHLGNPEFDYGYGLAHVILHTLTDKHTMEAAIQEYTQGYGDNNFNVSLIQRIVQGILLYRLNSVVPYPTALTPQQGKELEQELLHNLDCA